MTDITKKQITDYMKTIDTGTANGKVVMNQLKKALINKESADIPYSKSINKKVLDLLGAFKTENGKTISNKDTKEIKQGLGLRTGGKIYSNPSRKPRI
tara:strand:+ start:212 stop:505 length:294 start_codon:yes stop_codon:yes gene_type:complete